MSIAVEQPPVPWVKRWTKQEYNDLVERGAFSGQRIFLFRGEIIERAQHRHAQAFAITELSDATVLAFGLDSDYAFRVQAPFEVPGESMPEPDMLVCTEDQSLRRPHPNEAVFVAEVADSSLAIDREKGLEYAAAQVPEYWIVDVNNRRVEVYRKPVPDMTCDLGFQYAWMKMYNSGESIELLAKPGAPITVAQFFH